MEENNELTKNKVDTQIEDEFNDDELTMAADVSDSDIEIEELLGLLEDSN